MAARKVRFRPPEGWRKCEKLKADYEENGRAFGRLYLWYPEKAIRSWKMLGGLLGPKWKLEVYRFHWIRENQEDYRVWKKRREMRICRGQDPETGR